MKEARLTTLEGPARWDERVDRRAVKTELERRRDLGGRGGRNESARRVEIERADLLTMMMKQD